MCFPEVLPAQHPLLSRGRQTLARVPDLGDDRETPPVTHRARGVVSSLLLGLNRPHGGGGGPQKAEEGRGPATGRHPNTRSMAESRGEAWQGEVWGSTEEGVQGRGAEEGGGVQGANAGLGGKSRVLSAEG